MFAAVGIILVTPFLCSKKDIVYLMTCHVVLSSMQKGGPGNFSWIEKELDVSRYAIKIGNTWRAVYASNNGRLYGSANKSGEIS